MKDKKIIVNDKNKINIALKQVETIPVLHCFYYTVFSIYKQKFRKIIFNLFIL